MSVPEDPVTVVFSDGQEEAEQQIKLLCTRLLPGWADLQISDMQVSRISGGISNLLVKVEPPAPVQPVAVKVFGDKTELLIDREAEKQLLLRLNAVGFGAPVIGLFDNGRIERFLLAKTLSPEEMSDPRFVPHIARRLRAFHDLRLDPAAAATAGGPAGAGAAAGAAAAAAAAAIPDSAASGSDAPAARPVQAPEAAGGGEEPSQWDAIWGWLAMAEKLSFPHDAAKQAAYDKVDFVAMRAELTALREMCARVGSPRVLCHNDLLSGNILVVQQTPAQQAEARTSPIASSEQPALGKGQGGGTDAPPAEAAGEEGGPAEAAETCTTAGSGDDVLAGGELQLIDFEYSCYGPRGFDWGNHFNEYAGFDCVYDRFPAPAQQKAFFRSYLQPGELRSLAQQHLGGGGSGSGGGDGAADPTAAEGARSPAAEALAAAEEAALDRLVAEACVYALASHAYWGVWSFIQARYSPIDFDYLDYSRMRWAEYYRRREEFFALVERHFPHPPR